MRRFLRTIGMSLVLSAIALPMVARAEGPEERADVHKLHGTRRNRSIVEDVFRRANYFKAGSATITFDRGVSIASKLEGNNVVGKFHVAQRTQPMLLPFQRRARKFRIHMKGGTYGKGFTQEGYVYESRNHGNLKVMFFGEGERRNGVFIREAYGVQQLTRERDGAEEVQNFFKALIGEAQRRN